MNKKNSTRKVVLIAGGAGFIGSHLCEVYLQKGWEVICLDNFHTGSKDNIVHLIGNPKFELVRHDVINPYLAEVDLILNFACPASPVHYQSNPIKTMKTSVLGSMNLLGLAKRVGARYCQASTSEVYGDPLEHPQTEGYWGNVNPIGIRSCYDEGKRAAETLCMDYHRMHKVDIRLIRIFNTYGPRMDAHDGRVVSNFIVQALQGDDITIYGDGSQTRSFCYVDDLVRGIVAFCDQDVEIGPMNLGNEKEFTVKALAEKVVKLVGGRSKVVHSPLPQDDPKLRRPDLAKARKAINYETEVALDEGLVKTVEYFSKVVKV